MRGIRIYAIVAAAFMAGAFLASPELRAYAANTVGSADIINSSILSVDIKDGEVKAADLGGNAVTSAKIAGGAVTNGDIANNAVTGNKIADGTIAYGDLSRTLIAVEHRDDCDCGGTGWDPNGQTNYELLYDGRITKNSVVVVTVPSFNALTCSTYGAWPAGGNIYVICDKIIPDDMQINYAIFNNPAYG